MIQNKYTIKNVHSISVSATAVFQYLLLQVIINSRMIAEAAALRKAVKEENEVQCLPLESSLSCLRVKISCSSEVPPLFWKGNVDVLLNIDLYRKLLSVTEAVRHTGLHIYLPKQ